MCGRYWIEPEDDAALLRIIDRMQRVDPELRVKTEGEVFPGDGVPALCLSRAGNVRAFAMEWGYGMPGGRRLINARSETAAEKPLFRDSMRSRRCLLPMSAYFEWEHRGRQRVKYRIAPEADGLHFLAGLYRLEEGRPVCAVLTAGAAPEIAFIHDRMPVILPEEKSEDWLRGERLDLRKNPPLRAVPCEPEIEQLRMEIT